MLIEFDKTYSVKEFTDEELALSQSVFGLVPQSVYFNASMKIEIDTERSKLIYVYGLSGEGKSILKDELYEQLSKSMCVIDFDAYDTGFFFGKKISEIFDLKKDKDFLVSLFSSHGLFEMRVVFSRFEELSLGQQRRVRSMYMLYEVYRNIDKNSVLLVDELVTFLDSLSAKVFIQGLRKFINKYLPNVIMFGFGCNDSIIGYWEDVTVYLQNGKISKIEYVEEQEKTISH